MVRRSVIRGIALSLVLVAASVPGAQEDASDASDMEARALFDAGRVAYADAGTRTPTGTSSVRTS